MFAKITDWCRWVLEFLQRTFHLVHTMWSLRHDSVYMELSIDDYNKLYKDTTPEVRQENYKKIVTNYYNLSTLFYEWGWGPSFHFAPLKAGLQFQECLQQHELELITDIGINPGSRVLDVGCGIGGPARHIARITKAKITGLNINPMQISKAKDMTKKQELSHLVDYVVGDFCKMEFKDESFDAVYAIEATCHAPKREDVFSEIFRVLKKGHYFTAYEWCVTDKYDPKNEHHRSIIHKIEHGDGLSNTINFAECLQSLRNVGFEIIEYKDMYKDDRTWWTPLVGDYTKPSTFEFTPFGKWLLTKALHFMVKIRAAPRGVVKISDLLMEAADGLTAGGAAGIYTPGFYFKVRKPA